MLPVIASRMGGRRRGGPEVTGPFTGDGKTQGRRRGSGGAGPSWEEKGDGAAAEHFKGMIKGVPHQFLHL